MRQYLSFAIILALGLFASGCSGSFWGGAASGALGSGAGYEYKAHKEIEKLDEDLKSGRISQEEYNIRKDQIQKGSIVQ